MEKLSLTLETAWQTVPLAGYQVSGDFVKLFSHNGQNYYLIGDVSGHGLIANEEAQLICQYIDNEFQLPINEFLLKLHNYLQNGRGMVFVLLQHLAPASEIYYWGVGNIGFKIFNAAGTRSIMLSDGVLGFHCPKISHGRIKLQPNDRLVLHTDGISSKIAVTDYKNILVDEIEQIVDNIVVDFSRGSDDSGCLGLRVRLNA